jgi:hypothetical protein
MSKDNKAKIQTNPAEITKEDEVKLRSILEALEKDPLSYEFLNPVDTVGLGLVDYYDYVKYPMDIGTIGKKLKSNKYVYVQEVLDDIQQIWTNCKLYNMEGSDIYKMAESLEKLSRKLIDKHYKVVKPPPFNSKYNTYFI